MQLISYRLGITYLLSGQIVIYDVTRLISILLAINSDSSLICTAVIIASTFHCTVLVAIYFVIRVRAAL